MAQYIFLKNDWWIFFNQMTTLKIQFITICYISNTMYTMNIEVHIIKQIYLYSRSSILSLTEGIENVIYINIPHTGRKLNVFEDEFHLFLNCIFIETVRTYIWKRRHCTNHWKWNGWFHSRIDHNTNHFMFVFFNILYSVHTTQ
jgi:hypothetical protein